MAVYRPTAASFSVGGAGWSSGPPSFPGSYEDAVLDNLNTTYAYYLTGLLTNSSFPTFSFITLSGFPSVEYAAMESASLSVTAQAYLLEQCDPTQNVWHLGYSLNFNGIPSSAYNYYASGPVYSTTRVEQPYFEKVISLYDANNVLGGGQTNLDTLQITVAVKHTHVQQGGRLPRIVLEVSDVRVDANLKAVFEEDSDQVLLWEW